MSTAPRIRRVVPVGTRTIEPERAGEGVAMRILAISGSLRRDSHNTRLLRAAAGELPSGVELVLFDGLRDVPPFDEDDDGPHAPAAVRRLRTAIARGPTRCSSPCRSTTPRCPGSSRTPDWASRPLRDGPLRDRPAAVVGASTGRFGAVWAQAEARTVLAACGARVIDGGLALGHAADRFDAGGTLIDEAARAGLRALLAGLVGVARSAAVVA